MADDVIPVIYPTASYLTDEDKEEEEASKSGSAPITGIFRANPENTEGWTCKYEWRFTKERETTPYLIRYEEETTVTFNDYGSTSIVCYATFTNGRDSVIYGEEYWENEMRPFTCSVASSKLEMPNAFSPNGDGINDVYKPKNGYQSIVEFHAIIVNRWGQKLFEWDDPSQGWDGTYNGNPVKDGVYYCMVKAKGADGVKYNYKKDVNLLRGYNEDGGNNTAP